MIDRRLREKKMCVEALGHMRRRNPVGKVHKPVEGRNQIFPLDHVSKAKCAGFDFLTISYTQRFCSRTINQGTAAVFASEKNATFFKRFTSRCRHETEHLIVDLCHSFGQVAPPRIKVQLTCRTARKN